ncbi:MAG: arsenical pump-driving ATPase [Actinomycetes bacterium]
MKFLADPPRFLFFTGKGGVGKTSIACATALHLTRTGKKVLLVSTDPASNVGQVFGLIIGNRITPMESVPGLSALEIDPEQAATAYRERVIGPVRGLLPDRELASITEQLSGACTTEIASFNEFTDLLTDSDLTGGYDHIVFDTAPTGHTIRLLQLPGSWTDFLHAGKGDASCLGPLSGLDKQRESYSNAVATLSDPERTRMVLVTRAQASALAEVDRTYKELSEIGITDDYLVINAMMPSAASVDPLAEAVRSRESDAIDHMPVALTSLPQDRISLKPDNMVGIPALITLFDGELSLSGSDSHVLPPAPAGGLSMIIDELVHSDHGLVMCMGKGGVGKTTIAAAIAVALAHRGKSVLLTTTDPAANLVSTVHGKVTGLSVERIDPVAATRQYRERVMATKGKDLDDAGRRVLAEDLESPCTEEVAVFAQFSQAVLESRHKFVIMDTAPTGHTLLLLDATGSYHRDVARQMGEGMHFTTPLMQLQNGDQTKVLLVTLAEPTPVLEAEALQSDLERAGIHPWAWVINNSIAGAKPVGDFLRQRALSEYAQIRRVGELTQRVCVIPLLARDPVGEAALARLGESSVGELAPAPL